MERKKSGPVEPFPKRYLAKPAWVRQATLAGIECRERLWSLIYREDCTRQSLAGLAVGLGRCAVSPRVLGNSIAPTLIKTATKLRSSTRARSNQGYCNHSIKTDN
ncbi:hypothetical protein QR98_0072300 [Sarcoptes scabiei]|uniref:Uncharacterized protein n=1 Tax=Sarcoptes scabiei TaxID=52283 RepID=A0A132ACI0_SARSC|nr:hypothetical protein QR98_0072300 [Sarcoptes scabiei]